MKIYVVKRHVFLSYGTNWPLSINQSIHIVATAALNDDDDDHHCSRRHHHHLVSNSQVIGCEDRLWNDLYCVGWGVKLYSVQSSSPSTSSSSFSSHRY